MPILNCVMEAEIFLLEQNFPQLKKRLKGTVRKIALLDSSFSVYPHPMKGCNGVHATVEVKFGVLSHRVEQMRGTLETILRDASMEYKMTRWFESDRRRYGSRKPKYL